MGFVEIKDRKIQLGDKITRGKFDLNGNIVGKARSYRVIGLNPCLKLQEVIIIKGEEELGEVLEFDWILQNKLFRMFPDNDIFHLYDGVDLSYIWKGDF